MPLSPSQFERMFPLAAGFFSFFAAPGAACDEFGITTITRQAPFFAELHHESAGMTRLEESFAYTPARLATIWPFRFPRLEKAQTYVAKGPKAIASYVYAGRLGNGPEPTGDGWTYRGRGFIQLTGKRNYTEFGAALGLELVKMPSLASQPQHAARIAGRFWQTRGCNEMADKGNFVGITRAINGGLIGLKERVEALDRFRAILSGQEKAA